jgi:ParB family transcriptional regulator, chromosome partitioning protein
MTARPAQRVEWIPIDRITIVNPRERNRRSFEEIKDSIEKVGLKRPITVTRRAEAGGPFYDLVCGQGRLEACQQLGQTDVPALVVSADAEDCLISSLVENCARRQHNAIDLLQDIGRMREQGDSFAEIGRKTGLSLEYVSGISRLIEKGEQRLLRSVESRMIPITVAVEIAEAEDQNVQKALQSAYESGALRGKRLMYAKRLVENRRRKGKGWGNQHSTKNPELSSAALVRTYREDLDRKREIVRRANAARDKLLLVTEALRRLAQDERFLRLIENEGLGEMPANIACRLENDGALS